MQLLIDIPDRYFLNSNAIETSCRFKLYTALLMFHSGQLSAGAACEFAGVDRYTFLSSCKKHNIPVVDYKEDEIEADMNRLKRGRD
ncbi:MAG: UPF0175 family protein [bacterium]